MPLKMMTPSVVNRSGKEYIVDVHEGLGEDVTRVGDKVMIGYLVSNKKRLLEDAGDSPLVFTLGDGEYGPGQILHAEFDKAICGMKVQEARQIYMKLRSRNVVRDALYKLKLKRLPDFEYYQVTVLAILDENGRQHFTRRK